MWSLKLKNCSSGLLETPEKVAPCRGGEIRHWKEKERVQERRGFYFLKY